MCYTIRPYKKTDKERLRYICKETAFEPYKKDPNKLESVPIMFNDYFTEYEPEYIFVIVNKSDEAVGYIICSANYEQFMEKHKTIYTERLLQVAPDEVNFINGFMECLEKIKDRPIHIHMDMLPECQRQGFGTRLIHTLCDKLKADGHNHISVCCGNRNAASYALCVKLGFKEIYDYGNDCVSLSMDL